MNLDPLKIPFARLLGVGASLRHINRVAILDMFRGVVVDREAPTRLASVLIDASNAEPAALVQRLDSHPDGLTEVEADAIRETSGQNTIQAEQPQRWWSHLWHCYVNPFNLLLSLLAFVSYLTEDVKATIVIGSMVALSTILRFVQESRSNRAADRLKDMVSTTATVHAPRRVAARRARRVALLRHRAADAAVAPDRGADP